MKEFIYSSILVLFIFTAIPSYGQSTESKKDTVLHKHLIETSVLSPSIGIYEIIYNYNFNKKNAFVLGLAAANIDHEPNQTNSINLILGYRRYIWKYAHIEYQVWTGYNAYHEELENKDYRGLQAFNEFRLGYQFNFKIGKVPLNISPQGIFGFWLAEGNKPSSFESNPFILPNLNIGVKF